MSLSKKVYFPYISPCFSNPHEAAQKARARVFKIWGSVALVVSACFAAYLASCAFKIYHNALFEKDINFLSIASATMLVFVIFFRHHWKQRMLKIAGEAVRLDKKIPTKLDEAISQALARDEIASIKKSLQKASDDEFQATVRCLLMIAARSENQREESAWGLLLDESILKRCSQWGEILHSIFLTFTCSEKFRDQEENEGNDMLLRALSTLSLQPNFFTFFLGYLRFYMDSLSYDEEFMHILLQIPRFREKFISGQEVYDEKRQQEFNRILIITILDDREGIWRKLRTLILNGEFVISIPEEFKKRWELIVSEGVLSRQLITEPYESIPTKNLRELPRELFKKCLKQKLNIGGGYGFTESGPFIEQDLQRFIQLSPLEALLALMSPQHSLTKEKRNECVAMLSQKSYNRLMKGAYEVSTRTSLLFREVLFVPDKFFQLNFKEFSRQFLLSFQEVCFKDIPGDIMTIHISSQVKSFDGFFGKLSKNFAGIDIPERWDFPKKWAVYVKENQDFQIYAQKQKQKRAISDEEIFAEAMKIPANSYFRHRLLFYGRTKKTT